MTPVFAVRTPRRTGILIVMVVSLLAAGGMRQWASDWQQSAVPGQIVSSRAGLGSMNSYALALLLGGLRGPLVMFLWTTSENQKVDRDLEDLDTKIEWIRMLQPEFDTVHMFQIWNKAYNISVMMASPATKYTTILSAIDYAQDVLAERPDDMNLYESLGQVYGNKLSGESTQERPFYERQFRLESMTDTARGNVHAVRTRIFAGWGRIISSSLDDHGNILPARLLTPSPNRPRPAELAADLQWNYGSQLQYLKHYEPFPYGILPIAMAFNFDMASDAAMVSENQLPLQLSPLVTDSKPGLDLKQWSETESKLGITQTGQAFGLDAYTDTTVINNITLSSCSGFDPGRAGGGGISLRHVIPARRGCDRFVQEAPGQPAVFRAGAELCIPHDGADGVGIALSRRRIVSANVRPRTTRVAPHAAGKGPQRLQRRDDRI